MEEYNLALKELKNAVDRILIGMVDLKHTLEILLDKTKLQNKICHYFECFGEGKYQDEDQHWLCEDHYDYLKLKV